jgi:coproporphyrinogen III oxidase-like Fe-S oxidoreductase
MNAGVDVAEIQRRHGALPASTRQFLERLVEEGLAVRQATLFRLTEAGRLLADRIGEEILGLDETG